MSGQRMVIGNILTGSSEELHGLKINILKCDCDFQFVHLVVYMHEYLLTYQYAQTVKYLVVFNTISCVDSEHLSSDQIYVYCFFHA